MHAANSTTNLTTCRPTYRYKAASNAGDGVVCVLDKGIKDKCGHNILQSIPHDRAPMGVTKEEWGRQGFS
jgi:hypothetical protein